MQGDVGEHEVVCGWECRRLGRVLSRELKIASSTGGASPGKLLPGNSEPGGDGDDALTEVDLPHRMGFTVAMYHAKTSACQQRRHSAAAVARVIHWET
jgi:hypothetical protein